MAATSRIIIDNISFSGLGTSVTSVTLSNHQVNSQEGVLVVIVGYAAGAGVGNPTATFNGVPMQQLATQADAVTTGISILYLNNPPVGTYDVIALSNDSGASNMEVIAMTLMGVDKSLLNPVSNQGTTAAITTQIPSASSFMLEAIMGNRTISNPEWTQISKGASMDVAYSVQNPGLISPVWSGAGSHVAAVFTPAKAVSLWFPGIDNRSILDVARSPYGGGINQFGYFANNYWENSFLHTIGRIISPPPPIAQKLNTSFLSDSFNEPAVDSGKWTVFTGGGALLNENGGLVTVTYPSSSTSSTDGDISSSNTSYDFTGSYAFLQVLTVPSTLTSADAELRVKLNSTNFFRWVYEGGSLFAQIQTSGVTTTIKSFQYDAVQHAWWKIQESSGTISYYTSSDGINWVRQAETTYSFNIQAMTILIAGTCFQNETNPGQFIFSNFNVLPQGLFDVYNQSTSGLRPFNTGLLHTIGRIVGVAYPSGYALLSPENTQSKIIIDRITQDNTATFDHVVSSPDAVLVVLTTEQTTNGKISINGITYTPTISKSYTSGGSQYFSKIYYILNPQVGVNTIIQTGAGQQATAITLLGVDKKNINPQTYSAVSTNLNDYKATLTVYPKAANTLIIDNILMNSNIKSVGPNQILITNFASTQGQGVSYAIVNPGEHTLSWNQTNANSSDPFFAQTAIELTPSQAPSFWFPTISEKNIQNLIKQNALDVNTTPGGTNTYGNPPAIFYKNSFLQTVGRIISPPVTIATLVAETEQEASQIIIDKVFQGQVAAVALSTVNLNMDISIPSPDAVLVVTGGSVIATGAAWASVQYNGNLLTKLVQTGVAGQSAEIWYMPYPSVGTGTLAIASGTGGEIYANAMVLLGVDKKSTNITTASATDAAATTTIGASITPDAPNSLIIDTLSTLNATTFPVPDSSQTQVFNASALVGSEYLLSTYKLASGAQNMNYNLSVAVNASLVAVVFRPANPASMWFPNIDMRTLDDVVTVAGLDSEVNPAFGRYGYHASTFYLNSFLHTVGRIQKVVNPTVTATGSTLLMMGVS